jgi:transcriptional regulator with XRE-family HTH domain
MTAGAYRRELGANLRSVRQDQGMSLAGVEKKSRGKWKAVVLGTYERGDRSIAADKLAELADFYHADPADLMPRSRRPRMGLESRLALEQAAALLRGVLRDEAEVIP